MIKLIKLIVKLWVATSLIKAIAASNHRARVEGEGGAFPCL